MNTSTSGAPRDFPLRFRGILDPEQLQVGVGEEETPAGGPLPRVPVGRPFGEAERAEEVHLRGTDGRADEHVIELNSHGILAERRSRLGENAAARALPKT
jgi:hypothetical protein